MLPLKTTNRHNGFALGRFRYGAIRRREMESALRDNCNGARRRASASLLRPTNGAGVESFGHTNEKEYQQTSSATTAAHPRGSKRVLYLVALQSWDLFRSYLATHEGESYAKTYGLVADEKGRTSLHLACYCPSPSDVTPLEASTAPPDIIEGLISACEEAVSVTDSHGRTPLHLAAAASTSTMHMSVSSWKVMSVLIAKNAAAASVKDDQGKTPLLSLCETLLKVSRSCDARYCTKADRGRNMRILLSLIKMLCDAAPDSVSEIDASGKNALDYAMKADADPMILNFLTEAMKGENNEPVSLKPPETQKSRRPSRRWSLTDVTMSDSNQNGRVSRRRTSFSSLSSTNTPVTEASDQTAEKRLSWNRRTSGLLQEMKARFGEGQPLRRAAKGA